MDWDLMLIHADEEREFWLCDEQYFWSNAGWSGYPWTAPDIVWS